MTNEFFENSQNVDAMFDNKFFNDNSDSNSHSNHNMSSIGASPMITSGRRRRDSHESNDSFVH